MALRLVEFNIHPARFTHPSWYGEGEGVQAFCGRVFDTDGRIDMRAERLVSDWLLREHGLHELMDWEMREPQKRLWLFDRPGVARLAQELGLAMHREWLLRVIDAAQLRALQREVGAAAIRFVVEDLPGGLFHSRAPVVRFAVESSRHVAMKLKETGARTLLALLQPAWRAVLARAALYFDRSHALHEVAPFAAEHSERALELICNWLVPRRFPEWRWCF
jgi:YOP proteins translocation protein K (YscK)